MQKYAILLLIYIINPVSAMVTEQEIFSAIHRRLHQKQNPNALLYDDPPLYWTSCSDEHIYLTEQLLIAGADVEAKSNFTLVTPLHRAMHNFSVATTKLLLQHNANPNACTNLNETPLHYICSYFSDTFIAEKAEKRIEIVQLLLAAGANPNVKNNYGFMPLHFQISINVKAFFSQQKALAALLLKAGGDLVKATSGNATLLHKNYDSLYTDGGELLQYAIQESIRLKKDLGCLLGWRGCLLSDSVKRQTPFSLLPKDLVKMIIYHVYPRHNPFLFQEGTKNS